MRLIYERNIENMDYLEIIISQSELSNLYRTGISREFRKGFEGVRDLNVFLRMDKRYLGKEDEEAKESSVEEIRSQGSLIERPEWERVQALMDSKSPKKSIRSDHMCS